MSRHLAILLAAVSSLAPAQDQPSVAPSSPPAQNPVPESAKPAAEPAKPAAEPAKPAAEPAKPAAEPAKPAAEPAKPAAEPAKPAAEPAKPQIEKLGEGRYRIGTVTIDQKTREIRFPTKVNMTEGLLEYLICLQQGKIHEALLVTEISPTHLSLALTLLRYPTSKELFSTIDETGHMTGLYPEVPLAVKAGARIAIEVEWKDKDTTRRNPINEWLQHSAKNSAMVAGPWLYTGSEFYEGKFVPEMTGDIAAIRTDPGSMINYPGSDNDDNVWYGYPKRIPPKATPVTVIITPFYKPRTLPKP
jgi:hypothetical protein